MPSVQRTIRKSMLEIIQSKDATTGERLEACRILLKIRASANKGKPRGRAFLKKATDTGNRSKDYLERILSAVNGGG